MARYDAFVESLEHEVTKLAGNFRSADAAERVAIEYIRKNPLQWKKFDSLIVVKRCRSIPVEEILLA